MAKKMKKTKPDLPSTNSKQVEPIPKNIRFKAEEKLKSMSITDQETMKNLSIQEVNEIIYDLHVHQIELEMQNEELKSVQSELYELKSRYFDLFDLAPIGYLILTDKGLIIEANLLACKMLNTEREKLKRARFPKFILPADQNLYYRMILNLHDLDSCNECDLRLIRRDGSLIWVHLKIVVMGMADNMEYRLVLTDISERKKNEAELIYKEQKFKSLVLLMDQGLALFDEVIDHNGHLIDFVFNEVNNGFTKMFGITHELCNGKRITELGSLIELDWITTLIDLAQSDTPRYIEKYESSTDRYYGVSSYSPGTNQLAVLFSDITDRVNKEKEIVYLSYHDTLTGLYNRHFYDEELKRLDTERNYPLSLIIGDVNGLKLINDSFGHQTGDQILIKTADILRSCCRTDDIIARL